MKRILVLGLLLLAWPGNAAALDHVQFRHENKTKEVSGKVLLTAQDGGMMLLAPDGQIWTIQPDELVEHRRDDAPFKPLTAEEIAKNLLAELPEGFSYYATPHYVILYGTSREYAVWCGALFQRLYSAFTNFWSKKGFDLSEPQFPLVAIVFPSRQSYLQYAKKEAGEAAKSIIGYYNLKTNRMIMYDLSESNSSGRGRARSTAAQISQILSQPDAAWNVATVVHEATHQIAFNCGLHARFSDCPRWFSEGIAMYFETPDLNSSKGWKSIGRVNRPRLEQFQAFTRKRPADSLKQLLTNDKRFQDTAASTDAYAEAWAFNYFLINKYPKQYVDYLQTLSAKKPMVWDDAAARLHDFQEAFGRDLETLDREFVGYVMRGR